MEERGEVEREVRGCEGGRSGKVGEGGEEGGEGRGEGERGDEGEKRGDKNVQCAPRRVTAYNRWHSRNRGRWGRRGCRFNQVLLLVQMRSYQVRLSIVINGHQQVGINLLMMKELVGVELQA